jgi:hypothetical protein
MKLTGQETPRMSDSFDPWVDARRASADDASTPAHARRPGAQAAA